MQDKTQQTIEAYNQNYSRFSAKYMQYDPYSKHVQAFAELLENGSTVLDVGCGPGNVAKQLRMLKNVKIMGIDLSPKMVELAQKSVPEGIFYVQDSREASFPVASFDAIVLSFSIVHLYEEEAFRLLENVSTWLRSGGLLYLSFMEGREPGFETTSFSSQPIFFNYFDGSKLEQKLQKQEIKALRVVRQDYLEQDGSNTTDVFIFGRKQ